MLPPEVVWAAAGATERRSTVAAGARQLELVQGDDGVRRVSRLISTEPRDFLEARWQPGREW